jgi:predicted transcriptional regulator
MPSFDAALVAARVLERLPPPRVLRMLRQRAGLSLAVVAAEVRIDKSSIARYEVGRRRPRGETLGRYVATLARLAMEAGDLALARRIAEVAVGGPWSPEASAILDRIIAAQEEGR